MTSKKKLIMLIVVGAFIILSVVATIAIIFAATQQTVQTSLNISYKVQDIDGSVSAKYTIGDKEEDLIPEAVDAYHRNGNALVFKASDTQNAGNLLFPEDVLDLTITNSYIDIQYTYRNTGSKHYIATMDFGADIQAENMKVEYSIDGREYSEQRYALVVPAIKDGVAGQREYWIRISIENEAKDARFKGDFDWVLNACDPQDEAYLSIPSFKFQATENPGEYKVGVTNLGDYETRLVIPKSINGDEVTTIVESTLTPEEKAMITSVYIPDSVTTIGDSAFNGFVHLEDVEMSQLSAGGASALNSAGLTTIGEQAFKDCDSLTEFVFPSTVKTIKANAFNGCDNLENVVFNAGITTINGDTTNHPFVGCTKLVNATIKDLNVAVLREIAQIQTITNEIHLTMDGISVDYDDLTFNAQPYESIGKEYHGLRSVDSLKLVNSNVSNASWTDFSVGYMECDYVPNFVVATLKFSEGVTEVSIDALSRRVQHIILPASVQRFTCYNKPDKLEIKGSLNWIVVCSDLIWNDDMTECTEVDTSFDYEFSASDFESNAQALVASHSGCCEIVRK